MTQVIRWLPMQDFVVGKEQGHGSQTFLEVVENSCNPGFVEMGQTIRRRQIR